MQDTGNDYYTFLELPALERLVDPQPGEVALDLATGNGLVARWLADHSVNVDATDGSHEMINHANSRTLSWSKTRDTSTTGKVVFEQLDLVSPEQTSNYVTSHHVLKVCWTRGGGQ